MKATYQLVDAVDGPVVLVTEPLHTLKAKTSKGRHWSLLGSGQATRPQERGQRPWGRASVHCALRAQVRNELHSYSQNKAGSPRLASPPTCRCSKSRSPRAGGQLGAKGHCRQGGLPALPVRWEGTTVNTRPCRRGLAPAFLQVWLPFT